MEAPEADFCARMSKKGAEEKQRLAESSQYSPKPKVFSIQGVATRKASDGGLEFHS